MNKKTYMIPALHIVKIHTEKLIAESMGIVNETAATDKGGYTKENQGSWGNVWDSDDDDE